MNNNCKLEFDKAKELIRRNKEKYGCDIKPEIQSFDYGNIHVQYFLEWENLLDNKIKKFTNLNDSKIIDMRLVFSEKGNKIDIHESLFDKRYIVLNGEVDLIFEDKSVEKIKSYDSYFIPKELSHGSITIRDTYIIVIES